MNPPNDLQPLLRWFDEFCASYRTDHEEDQRNFDLKEYHTHKVLDGARLIAAGWDPRRFFLAEVAALCHDLGRFPQYRNYGTFRDSDSVNHAHLSAQILSESLLLKEFPPEEARAVLDAVRLHNVYSIPEGLDGLSEHLLRLVRDADKLDIWRVFIDYYQAPKEERASATALGLPERSGCSPEVVATLDKGEMVKLATLKTLDDFKILQLSWLYDINFNATIRLVRERGIIESIASSLPPDEGVTAALDRLQRYLDLRLREKV